MALKFLPKCPIIIFLFITIITKLNAATEDGSPQFQEHVEFLQELAKNAKDLSDFTNIDYNSYENIPFKAGSIPPAVKLTEYLKMYPDKKDKIYPQLYIDGIQFIGLSFHIQVSSDIKFSHNKSRSCDFFMKKTKFRPVVDNIEVPIPCIEIGEHAGGMIKVLGYAAEDIQDILKSDKGWSKGSLYQLFYDNFFSMVLIPAINDCAWSNAYLRHSAMIDRMMRGIVFSHDFETPIVIGYTEWPEIGLAMDKYKQKFFDAWKWQLYIGLLRVGQNIPITESYSVDDVIETIGLNMFIDEASLAYFNIHIAVNVYAEIENATLLPKREEFKNAIAEKSKSIYYPILGMGTYPNLVIKNSFRNSLKQAKYNLFEYHNLESTIKSNFEYLTERFGFKHCKPMYKEITFEHLHAYLASTHATFPKRYMPHGDAPASAMIMSGLQTNHLQTLRNDFNLWKNLITQIQKGMIPMRLEFVLEGTTFGKGDKDSNIQDFSCTASLMESIMEAVYGYESEGVHVPGSISEFLIGNLYIMPQFVQHLTNSISSLYLMVFCPLLDAYDISKEKNVDLSIASMYDLESLLTVHLGENLLMYMYSGDMAYYKDYTLLKDLYKVSAQSPLKVENIVIKRNRCGSVDAMYPRSQSVLDAILKKEYVPYLAKYEDPASYQRYFIIRQLSLIGTTLGPDNAGLAVLYVDSCIVAMRHFPTPILPTEDSNQHTWLTNEKYKESFGRLPKDYITVAEIKNYFLSPAFIKNIDVIGVFLLRASNSPRQRFEKKAIDAYIEKVRRTIYKHIFGVVTNYATSGKLEVFYKVTEKQLEDMRVSGTFLLRTFSQLKLIKHHAKISVGARQLFALKTSDGRPVRFLYSVPGEITKEIVDDVFKVMQEDDALKVSKLALERLNFLLHPVLPIIFRLWYNDFGDDTDNMLETYTDFLNHCAYIVTYILWNMKDDNRLGVIRTRYTDLAQFGTRRHLNYAILERAGLIYNRKEGKKIEAVKQNDIKEAYRYWIGGTMILEKKLPVELANDNRGFFTRNVLNRFHYTPCDALGLNVNSNGPENRKFVDFRVDGRYGHVPDVYFFMPYFKEKGKPKRTDVQKYTNVMRVHKKFKYRRWVREQDENLQPKFLPIYMDQDADSITKKELHENLPYKNMYEANGQYFKGERRIFDKKRGTHVYISDILDYSKYSGDEGIPEVADELETIEFDENARRAIEAWRMKKRLSPDEDSEADDSPEERIAETPPMLNALINELENFESEDEILEQYMPVQQEPAHVYIGDNVIAQETMEECVQDEERKSPRMTDAEQNVCLPETNHPNVLPPVAVEKTNKAASQKKKKRGRQAKRVTRRKLLLKNLFGKMYEGTVSAADDGNNEMDFVQNDDVTVEEQTCDVERTVEGRYSVTCDDVTTNFATQYVLADSQTNEESNNEQGSQADNADGEPPLKKKKILQKVYRGVYVEKTEGGETSGQGRYSLRSQGAVNLCAMKAIARKRLRKLPQEAPADIVKSSPILRNKFCKSKTAQEVVEPSHNDDGTEICASDQTNENEANNAAGMPTGEEAAQEQAKNNEQVNAEGKEPRRTERVDEEDAVRENVPAVPQGISQNQGNNDQQRKETDKQSKGAMWEAACVEEEDERRLLINVKNTEPDDWYVIEVDGDGSRLLSAVDVMLRGYAKIERKKAVPEYKDVNDLRQLLSKCASFKPDDWGKYSQTLSIMAINKNVFGHNDHEIRKVEFLMLQNEIAREWGGEDTLRFITYFLGIPINVLYATTSRSRTLDWGIFKWFDEVNPEKNLLNYKKKMKLGPPLALIYEQWYSSGQLHKGKWNVLVHKDKYHLFEGFCKIALKYNYGQMIKLNLNRDHFNIGIKLTDYLEQFHSKMEVLPHESFRQGGDGVPQPRKPLGQQAVPPQPNDPHQAPKKHPHPPIGTQVRQNRKELPDMPVLSIPQNENIAPVAVRRHGYPIALSNLDDWHVIPVSGDGDCLYYAFLLMIQGFADADSSAGLRNYFANYVTLDATVLGEQSSKFTPEALNRNVFLRVPDRPLREDKAYETLMNQLVRPKEWGDERMIKLFTWFASAEVHLLFPSTSQDYLDWGTFDWSGPKNDGPFFGVNQADFFGPPFALILENRQNEQGLFEGSHFMPLIHKTAFERFRNYGNKVIPLRKYLNDHFEFLQSIGKLPNRRIKQGPQETRINQAYPE